MFKKKNVVNNVVLLGNFHVLTNMSGLKKLQSAEKRRLASFMCMYVYLSTKCSMYHIVSGFSRR